MAKEQHLLAAHGVAFTPTLAFASCTPTLSLCFKSRLTGNFVNAQAGVKIVTQFAKVY
jgi:hypothetical protein